jgi:hypothetical protein
MEKLKIPFSIIIENREDKLSSSLLSWKKVAGVFPHPEIS